MEYSLVKCLCVVLAATVVCFDVSLCLIHSNLDSSVETAKQNKDPKYASPMWFGPRLGRKKRTDKMEDYKIADILESLDEYPWTLFAINENSNDMEKRGGKEGNKYSFPPRLGRTLEDAHSSENFEISERPLPFSPRLGRGHTFSPYSPRLGRDESYVL